MPSGTGGSPIVGVSSRSKPASNQAAISAADQLVQADAARYSAALRARGPSSASAQVSGSTSSAVDLRGRARIAELVEASPPGRPPSGS